MKQILIVTHAQAQHHLDGVVGGWHDSSLSELGNQQALKIASSLKQKVSFSDPLIFSSDLKRAVETATPIASAFNTGLQQLKGLREMSYGYAEGKAQSWLDQRFNPPPAPENGDRMNHRVCIGAESRRDFAERIYETMNHIFAETETCSIVVSHGFAHTFIVSWWIGLPLEHADYVHFNSSAGAITSLLKDDTYHNHSVEIMNDRSHLTD